MQLHSIRMENIFPKHISHFTVFVGTKMYCSKDI